MPRPTKASLQRTLLGGEAITYKDGNKSATVRFASTQTRNLFDFLLTSEVREAKDLPKHFIDGLWHAVSSNEVKSLGTPDTDPSISENATRTWRIERLTTRNFGGLNVYGGDDFTWDLKGESWLLDGENASGKSSLLGAIAWAFTGKRPRDEASPDAHLDAEVHDSEDKKIGSWPPLACYPNNQLAIGQSPEVEVVVELVSDDGHTAKVQRALRAGKVHWHSTIAVEDVFVSTGIEMPLILPTLRLKDKGADGALSRAVSELTGLDELVSIGELADGLCHGAREYSSYAKKMGLPAKLADFESQVAATRAELSLVGRDLPNFTPKDAVGKDSLMALLASDVEREASTLAGSLAVDLASDTDTSKLETQREIVVALTNASAAVSRGLTSTMEWKSLAGLEQALRGEAANAVMQAVENAERQVREALDADSSQQRDSRHQLKAIASSWHSKYRGGPVEDCPLCDQSLMAMQPLRTELDTLVHSGGMASQSLQHNLLSIREALHQALPTAVEVAIRSDLSPPRQSLISAVRREFGAGAQFGRLLKRLTELVDDALVLAPARDLSVGTPIPNASKGKEELAIELMLHRVRSVVELAAWFRDVQADWILWWEVATNETSKVAANVVAGGETVRDHLRRLTSAMDGAKPYARAASTLGSAIRVAEAIVEIQLEQKRREQVVDALHPLKQLPGLAQSVARQTLEDLSGRIRTILEGMHTSERFRYRAASLHKREGLIVKGSFESDLRVDATLIANSSWLRSALWAFVFALREEAVDQHGTDQLPVWLFDDPQSTFDMAHRLNWSSYVAALQTATPRAQVVIATHDETFAAKLRQSDLQGREAALKAATSDSGPLAVLEGSQVQRRWEEASADPSSKHKAVVYLSDARVFLEGMLKAMLAGQGGDIRSKSVSELRVRMIELGKQGIAPWDKRNFTDLARALGNPALESLHKSHHSDRAELSFSEAKAVSVLWPNVARLLDQCFRDIRDHRLLHGMPSAFQLAPPSLDFPEGFRAVVAQHSLPLLGRASAFSGRVSDGALHYEEFGSTGERAVRLGQHSGYRLGARTLEPVAKPGDILLVHETLEPAFRSLVVAIAGDQLVARRYVISEASSDVAVLTANALDPYEIAAPVVARKETIKVRRIVGVLFDRATALTAHEVQACGSESEIEAILSRCNGLVEVVGQSAQPLALNGQYLLVGERVGSAHHLKRLDGLPVIARDSDNAHYFKRLRLTEEHFIILESLDGGGEFPPEVLWDSREGGRTLEEAWEVLGVLFERP